MMTNWLQLVLSSAEGRGDSDSDITPFDVVMKISSMSEQKTALAHEYEIYCLFEAPGVTKGIGRVLGLFQDVCEPGDSTLDDGLVFDSFLHLRVLG